MNVNSGSSPPTKKRKDNDDRVDAPGAYHDAGAGAGGGGFLPFSGRGEHESFGPSHAGYNMSQLDRMEQMMTRMEEKLSTVSSLESRCTALEEKCSSIESKLDSTSQSVKDHVTHSLDNIDKKCERLEKLNEFNTMVLKNQSWEPFEVETKEEWLDGGYDDDDAAYLVFATETLKDVITKLRRGNFPSSISNDKGIYLSTSGVLHPRRVEFANEFNFIWNEFAAALDQFTPAINLLPDDSESYIHFNQVNMSRDASLVVSKALTAKPFQSMSFTHNTSVDYDDGGMSMDVIMDIVESNKHLRKLHIRNNIIRSEHIERLCSVVYNQPLVELDITNCFDADRGNADLGNVMLTSLLTSGELTLLKLIMRNNNITSDVSVLLANFIATNPRLKYLDLSENELNDSDAALISNALRSNTTLRSLELSDNNITTVGRHVCYRAICDRSSLNAIADSNHFCQISFGGLRTVLNCFDTIDENRGKKIYSLLACRHKTMTNVQHFSDIDVKILPNILEVVQKYEKSRELAGPGAAKSISIVYEIVCWEKVLNLLESQSQSQSNS